MRRVSCLIVLSCLLAVTPLGCAQEARQGDPRQWKIVFDSPRDGNREIYVMDSDGSHQQRLTLTPGKGKFSWLPAWSPDRKKIAFAVAHSGKDWEKDSDIYVMNTDGTNLHRLTRTPGWEYGSARWSPDGEKIIFYSKRERDREQYQVYVMDDDGSNVRQLPKDDRPGGRAYWSPDGKKIVFGSANSWDPKDLKNWGLYVMDADGSNVRRLSGDKAGDTHPAW